MVQEGREVQEVLGSLEVLQGHSLVHLGYLSLPLDPESRENLVSQDDLCQNHQFPVGLVVLGTLEVLDRQERQEAHQDLAHLEILEQQCLQDLRKREVLGSRVLLGLPWVLCILVARGNLVHLQIPAVLESQEVR